MTEPRLCLGVVAGVHGVHGLVRIKSFTAAPEDVASYGPVENEAGNRSFQVEVSAVRKGVVIARIAGVDDRDGAEALKGVRLYVSRAALPEPEEEEWYHADLIGLDAVLKDGEVFGKIRQVHDYGAGDSLEIDRADGGGTVMLPFTKAAVPVVDVKGGKVVVEPPEGLLEPPGKEEEKKG